MKDCCTPEGGAYDLAVIGAGSAGFSAAITAAEAGARVALIGDGTIGGTCVNVGCVPSKALIRAVEGLHQARGANRFDGIEAEGRVTDWAATVAQKQALVDELRAAKYADVLPRHENVDYIEGRARFDKQGRLTVDGVAFPAAKIVIATGSRRHVPAIPAIEEIDALDSTSALELSALPASLLVVGAGYIGVELAQLFARAGVIVTLVSRRGVLPEAEPEISEALERYLADEGIRLARITGYESVARDGSTVRLAGTGGESFGAERLLLATGRVPNSDDLNLNATGIETDGRGGIVVDAQMRTANPHVWAAGDVTGRDQFVYMAAYGAKLAARNAVAGETRTYDNGTMPWVVFSDPQVAGVGLSEAQARTAGYEVVTSVLPLDAVPRALAARDTRGLIKLVAEAGSKRLLGAQILAPEGADSIQTAAMALKAGLTYEELGDTIMPYLTTVEGLKLAAQTFEKDVAALSCCAGQGSSSPADTERSMPTFAAYIGAALAEIAGCFAFWAWLRLDKPIWWVGPGMASLALFAYLLTLVDSAAAGRAYAAYGGIYIAASLFWLWAVEGVRPDRWDAIGVGLCLLGAFIILAGPRAPV